MGMRYVNLSLVYVGKKKRNHYYDGANHTTNSG